jgi:hypothetical protein
MWKSYLTSITLKQIIIYKQLEIKLKLNTYTMPFLRPFTNVKIVLYFGSLTKLFASMNA